MEINLRTIGSILVGFSIIMLFLLTVIKIDNDTKSNELCERYHELGIDMSLCPAHNSFFSWDIIIAYGINFMLLIMGLYLIFMPKTIFENEPKKDFKKFDITKLDDEEKLIYDFIKGKGGSSYQSDIIKETNFSKVKTTRILDKLESRGVVERKRRGMTNIIILK